MNKLVDIYYSFRKHSYPIVSREESYSLIEKALNDKTPLFIGRLGATECFVLRVCEFNYFWKRKKAVSQLYFWSGFFPNDVSLLRKFFERYTSAISNLDLAVPWSDFRGEDYFFHKYCKKDIMYSYNMSIGSDYENNWLRYMEGRTLLVVHPFASTIEKQYQRIEKVYPNKRIFPPNLNLKTYKAVQTIGDEVDGRFCDWFDALDFMCTEIDEIEYDVAIIACGAYGVPLGAHIKDSGKIALVVGGGLQGAFGIIGKRWEKSYDQDEVNEYWVHPSEEETPKAFAKVEDGCYW